MRRLRKALILQPVVAFSQDPVGKGGIAGKRQPFR